MEIKGLDDTIEWYDNNAEAYDEGLGSTVPVDDIEVFLKYLSPQAFVLEAGCGPGRESSIFHDKGIKTIGVDISKGLLEIARRKNPDVEFVQANFLNLPFSDKMFDGVFSHASLVHLEKIEDVEKALQEFNRVLKPEGIVYIYVKQQTGEEKTAVVKDSLSNHDRFFRYYSMEEMTSLLTEAHFAILHTALKDDSHGRVEVKWIEIITKKVS